MAWGVLMLNGMSFALYAIIAAEQHRRSQLPNKCDPQGRVSSIMGPRSVGSLLVFAAGSRASRGDRDEGRSSEELRQFSS